MHLESLELRHLRALHAVANGGTFAAAAETLGFTQSAVSQQIASLEKVIGEPVFDRHAGPKRVTLTAAGKVLLGHADHLLDHLDLLDRELDGLRNGMTGVIDVGVFQSIAVRLLPAVMGRLRAEAPSIEVRVRELTSDQNLIQYVLEGEVDVSFMTIPFQDAGLRTVPLMEDPFVAIVPGDWNIGPVCSLDEIAARPLIGQPNNDTCQMRIETGLRSHGLAAQYVFRSADNAAVQSMVRAGMGAAVMPLLAVDPHDPTVRVVRLEPGLPPRTISVVVRRETTPLVERFVDLAVEVAAEVAASTSTFGATAA